MIVIDSFGIGYLPDAEKYGDAGANTALHICQTVPDISLPNLQKLGLGNCSELLGNPLPGVPAQDKPLAHFGVMKERSPGKDTTTGHWELSGLVLDKPFHTFPPEHPSFPREILKPFCEKFGVDVLGNEAASGTEIIQRLGEEHMKTGNPIVYTSADSVFQIAAHEEVISIDKLYEMCRTARGLCDPWQVGRVIARPFIGEPGDFTRTEHRKDFSIALPGPSVLDILSENGIKTIAVGKIGDIFNEKGIAESHHDKGNPLCIKRTLKVLEEQRNESFFMFVNYVDTDMIWGHRRDPQGYYNALAEIDANLPAMLDLLDEGDLFIITADHGCDPTWRGNDHTREHVPLLAFRKGEPGRSIGVRESFSDAAQSIAHYFNTPPMRNGENFLN